jgi:hypothetical protein
MKHTKKKNVLLVVVVLADVVSCCFFFHAIVYINIFAIYLFIYLFIYLSIYQTISLRIWLYARENRGQHAQKSQKEETNFA